MFEHISVNQFYPRWLRAREAGESLALIDVRTVEEFKSGHVPGAQLISLGALPAKATEMIFSGTTYLICHSGARSAQAADYLARVCNKDSIVTIDGGTLAWKEACYPIE